MPACSLKDPKYVVLADELRAQIEREILKPGDRLPSFVEMRAKHGVTINTVERAYAHLEKDNLVVREQGRGTFVTTRKSTLTGSIGFVGAINAFVDSSRNPFNAHLMAGVQEAVELKQQHLLYMGTNELLDLDACEKVDGVLIYNTLKISPMMEKLRDLLPCVSLLAVMDGVTSIVCDDYRGAQMAMRHLLDLGHRRIACLMEVQPMIAQRRFAGYKDALQEFGIEAEPSWIHLREMNTYKKVEQPYLEWARLHMQEWLQDDWRKLGCTAILVQNEVAAIGVMQTLQKEGIKIPEEVSVMTFDGTEICNLVTPCLSTMAVPLTKIGSTGVEMLNRQVAGEKSNEQVIMLPMSLREGESVAPPQVNWGTGRINKQESTFQRL